MSNITRRYRPAVLSALISATLLFSAGTAQATRDDMPILVVGASYENASTPINDDLSGPLNGFAVGVGSYLSLGDALVRSPLLNGFVINEAQAGAGTFDHHSCVGSTCTSAFWQGFDVQFQKALMRVSVPDPQNPDGMVINARYLVIGIPNDCLHSNSLGIPEADSHSCTLAEMNAVVDRIGAVAQKAAGLGITPIIPLYPSYKDLDLVLFRQLFGLYWAIGESDFNTLKNLHQTRLSAEVPQAILVDAWKDFVQIGDGIHPDYRTTTNAARRIALAIQRHEAGQ